MTPVNRNSEEDQLICNYDKKAAYRVKQQIQAVSSQIMHWKYGKDSGKGKRPFSIERDTFPSCNQNLFTDDTWVALNSDGNQNELKQKETNEQFMGVTFTNCFNLESAD